MPIELTWMIPDKILLSRWCGPIDDYHIIVMVEEMGIILDNTRSLVHTLIDLSEVGHISPNMIILYLKSRVPFHPRRGRICGCWPTMEGEILADLLNRITQHEMIRLFPTREAALEFLITHDSPPPPLSFGPNLPPSHTDLPASNH